MIANTPLSGPLSALIDRTLLLEQALVDGVWIDADDGGVMPVTDPATDATLARVADLGAAETERAIEAAAAAFPGWRACTAKERAAILRRWHELILANQDDLALLLTLENGKPLAEARGEIAFAAGFVEWFAEEAKRVYGDLIPTPIAGRRILTFKEPIGVVAAITPWNFPAAMITRKVAPALAVGCTVVVKPAEDTPLSALALGALALRAGFPPGVLNIVTTARPAEVGGVLTAHPLVRKLSFTGSTATGKLLMRQSADTVKKVSLELGGNAPFIVFDDADLEAAVKGAVASKYRNSGQTCICANRFLVQDGIFDAFAERFGREIAALKVGPGTEPGVQQGPLINAAALAKVDELVDDAVTKGAVLVIGGGRHERGGTFYRPTLLIDATPAMRMAREEIFGPVAALYRFSDEAQAVAMANDTEFGLAAYFYTRDAGRIWRVAEALDYGMVGVNEGLISTEVAPFGGVKHSGIGREGSRYGVDDFVEIKYICLGLG
ncbi:MAG: NAD-dependent succinate-semialdehyde dehydrogenase [Rhodospirillaceae bacterium]